MFDAIAAAVTPEGGSLPTLLSHDAKTNPDTSAKPSTIASLPGFIFIKSSKYDIMTNAIL